MVWTLSQTINTDMAITGAISGDGQTIIIGQDKLHPSILYGFENDNFKLKETINPPDNVENSIFGICLGIDMLGKTIAIAADRAGGIDYPVIESHSVILQHNLYVTSRLYALENVGIGTTNPTSSLHVIGDVNLSNIVVPGSAPIPGYVLSTTGSQVQWVAQATAFTQPLANLVVSNSVTTTNLFARSNVGIGTNSPRASLDVVTPGTPGVGSVIAQFGSTVSSRLVLYDEYATRGLPGYIYGNGGNGLGFASPGAFKFYPGAPSPGTEILFLNSGQMGISVPIFAHHELYVEKGLVAGPANFNSFFSPYNSINTADGSVGTYAFTIYDNVDSGFDPKSEPHAMTVFQRLENNDDGNFHLEFYNVTQGSNPDYGVGFGFFDTTLGSESIVTSPFIICPHSGSTFTGAGSTSGVAISISTEGSGNVGINTIAQPVPYGQLQVVTYNDSLDQYSFQVCDNGQLNNFNAYSMTAITRTEYATSGTSYYHLEFINSPVGLVNGYGVGMGFYGAGFEGSQPFILTAHSQAGGFADTVGNYVNSTDVLGSVVLATDGTGHVGIGGQLFPSCALDVQSQGTASTGQLMAQFGSKTGGRILFYDENTSYPPYIRGKSTKGLGLSSTGPLVFYQGSEVARFSGTRLGIGTTNPTSNLHVIGDVNLSNIVVPGSTPTPGYVLSTTGSKVQWVAQASAFTQPLANLVVSNTVTTTNIISSIGTFSNISGNGSGLTSVNAANVSGTFLLANVGTLNVTTLENVSNLSAILANVGTLNVTTLENVSNLSAILANVGTLNVTTLENVSNLSAILANVGTLNVSTLENVSNLSAILANVGTLNVSTIESVSNLTVTQSITSPGFYSNVSNTNFYFDTFTIPFIYSTTLNVATVLTTQNFTSTLSNISTLNVSTLETVTNLRTTQANVSTLNVSSSFSVAGQISTIGNATPYYGVCPPLTARQGVAASSSWNPSGGTQGNFFLNSGVMQMQVGSNTMAVSPTTISFPIGYVNNPIVLLTPYSTTASTAPWVSAITTTSFQVTWTNFGTFEWMSIGM